MSENDLRDLRAKIDEIDEKLVNLLAKRISVVDKIMDSKMKMGKAVRDLKREQDVIEKVREEAIERNLDPDFVEDLMRLTMAHSAAEEREVIDKPSMWAQVEKEFSGNPAQLSVARILYKYGLRAKKNGDVLCGDIRVPHVQIAKEAGVDRRAVDSTVETIFQNEFLTGIFSSLRPVPYLKGIARQLGLGLIEIVPTDATQEGIISEVTDVISDHGLSVRQSITDDPYFVAQPKLTIITGEPVGGEVINELRKLPSVDSLIVY
ncbi:MAG: chorismate mutase [Candidatus Hadarchaeia archaeon]